jgi:hypothetical protein
MVFLEREQLRIWWSSQNGTEDSICIKGSCFSLVPLDVGELSPDSGLLLFKRSAIITFPAPSYHKQLGFFDWSAPYINFSWVLLVECPTVFKFCLEYIYIYRFHESSQAALYKSVAESRTTTKFLQDFLYASKSICSGAQYVTLQKHFSHPSFIVICFFPTPPIKLKLGLQ